MHVLGALTSHLPVTLHSFLSAGEPFVSGAVLGISLPKPPPYDDLLSWFLESLIFLANVAGGLVVGVATVRGLAIYVMDLIRFDGGDVPKEGIRLSLGRALALALEFQLGADILATALNPTSKDVAVLAAIIVLRTLLNFFLQRELAEAARRAASVAAVPRGRAAL